MHFLTVKDLMSSPVITIPPHTRLPMIKQLMRLKRIHRLPVVDCGKLLGIVTLGDVRNAYPSDAPSLVHEHRPPALDKVCAGEIMRTDLITIQAGTPVIGAVSLMLQHKINGLPVMDRERLVGIITKSDVCRALVAGDRALAPNIHEVSLVAAG